MIDDSSSIDLEMFKQHLSKMYDYLSDLLTEDIKFSCNKERNWYLHNLVETLYFLITLSAAEKGKEELVLDLSVKSMKDKLKDKKFIEFVQVKK